MDILTQFELFWATLEPLVLIGITVGVVLAVIFGSIKIGWKFAPWIVLFGLIIMFLN